jgi:hypothetical protein
VHLSTSVTIVSPSKAAKNGTVILAQRLPKLDFPEGIEVNLRDHTLSKGGVEMLGRMLLRRLPQTTE